MDDSKRSHQISVVLGDFPRAYELIRNRHAGGLGEVAVHGLGTLKEFLPLLFVT